MTYFEKEEFTMGELNVFDKMDSDFLCLLDELRYYVGEPLHINSSYRSEEYNNIVNGSLKSQHLIGNAVDLHCDNSTLRRMIVEHALSLGLTCGIAKNFVHIDNRLHKIVFTY